MDEEEFGDAYWNEQNYPFCGACGGTLEYMGILGNLIWLRCIDCGMEIHVTKEREDDAFSY
jgi:hypothetical protein